MVVVAWIVGAAALAPTVAAGQEPAAPQPSNGDPPLTLEQAQAHLAEAEAATGLDAAPQAELVSRWQDVVEAIRTGTTHAARAVQFQQQIDQVPQRLEELQAAAETPVAEADPEVEARDVPLPELEQELAAATTNLDEARARLAELEAEPERRAARRKSVPEAIAQARERLEEVRAQAAAAAADSAEVTEPARILPAARLWGLTQVVSAYEKEIRYYDAAGQLLTLSIDRAVAAVGAGERKVKQLQELLLRQRQIEARDAATEARMAKEVTTALPYFSELAESWRESNEAMARERTGPDGLLARTQETQNQVHAMEALVDSVTADFTSVSKRIEAVGLNNAVGMLLRTYLTDLPRLDVHRSNIKGREESIAELQLDLIQLREERLDVADVEPVIANILGRLPASATEDDRLAVERVFRELLRNKRDNLDALIADSEAYFTVLQNLDSAERELFRETSEFQAYIDERVLWIASSTPLGMEELGSAWSRIRWLVERDRWRAMGIVAVRSLRQFSLQYLLLAVVSLLLFGFHRRMRATLKELGGKASKRSMTSIRPTMEATILSAFLAAPAPLALWSAGWLLASTSTEAEFTVGFGNSLQRVAIVFLLLAFLRQLLRKDGVAEAHFGWATGPVESLRRHLAWLTAVSLPLVFLVELSEYGDGHNEALSRILFIALMLAVATFTWIMLDPRRAAIHGPFETRRGNEYGNRLRAWSRVLATLTPVLLALVATAGYFYTARRLVALLYLTIALTVVLLFVYGLILRWLGLARRALAMDQARKRLAALKARTGEGEQPEALQQEVEVDLAKVDVQTQRLVRSLLVLAFLVGVWVIWAETLPALNILNGIELPWKTTRSVEHSVMVDGETVEQREDVEVPVTGVHVLAAVLIAVMTLAATRNLPGLLEIAVLQRLSMAAGERYAITTVTRYLLAVLGGLMAFQAIGIGWAKVQWLVAAVGLGLGFGLQEIFANFVSGLIILFERPLRVGDTVTVGGISGTVTRVRIRATTITDFDRKELIVPNKEFVTSQLVNWTLSNTTLRIVIPIGVAYGSDTRRVETLLFELARAHPDVMREPAPEVWFLSLGESTLNFELRVYSAALDTTMRIKHDLLMRIHETFRNEGIELAFPQRDVHVRSIDGALPMIALPNAPEAPRT